MQGNCQKLTLNKNIDLVVTSPPYPMIKMWDTVFSKLNPYINPTKNPQEAFELMHSELNAVWDLLYDAVQPGGFVCISNFTEHDNHLNDVRQKINEHARKSENISPDDFTRFQWIRTNQNDLGSISRMKTMLA